MEFNSCWVPSMKNKKQIISRHRWKWTVISVVMLVVGFPRANSATSTEVYQFPVVYNTTSLESLYKDNCTNISSSCYYDKDNNNTNETFIHDIENEPLGDLILMGVLSLVLGLMILVTVIGNVFVIAAILIERNLQNVANYLIVSLAVADLMVACLVMPLGAVYVISNNWMMGPEVCDMWTSIDVLCCTASILHLVAIAVDRYWAVTNVDYIHTRNSSRIGIMIVVVWIIALVVSLSPQIPQFKDPDYLYRINIKKQCLVSQDVKYQIFATSSTFYLPLLIIFVLYWKIFQTARKRIRKRRHFVEPKNDAEDKSNNKNRIGKSFLTKRAFLRIKKYSGKQSAAAEALVNSIVMMEGQSTATTMENVEEVEEPCSNKTEETTAFTISKPSNQSDVPLVSNNVSPEKSSVFNNGSTSHQSQISDIGKAEMLHKEVVVASCPASVDKLIPSRKEKKESLEAKRERKAAKTLAIITGAFVMCWLPFFLLALLLPLCGEDSCNISGYIMSFALWLGYFNSTLNPVIYTIFSPEFRQAFKRILCGGQRGQVRNYRSGKRR